MEQTPVQENPVNNEVPQGQEILVDSNPQNPPKLSNKRKILAISALLITLVIIVVTTTSYCFKDLLLGFLGQENAGNISQSQVIPTTKTQDAFLTSGQTKMGDYLVEIKENSLDELKSDIYLLNSSTEKEEFFITLPEVLRDHYHSAEYHNGNVYIIKRNGGELGYINNPDWEDELWVYNSKKEGKMLFSIKGLDFRVSDDEKGIIIRTRDNLYLLNSGGNTIKKFSSEELKPDKDSDIGFLAWIPNAIWLDGDFGPSLAGITRIDSETFKITKYNLTNLDAGPEYTFNPGKKLLAYSDYPAIFDTYGRDNQIGKQVTLRIYNIETKQEEIIAQTVTKRFKPNWLDDLTLEYNNPNGEGRITKSF